MANQYFADRQEGGALSEPVADKPHVADLPIDEILRNAAREARAVGRTVIGMKNGTVVTFSRI